MPKDAHQTRFAERAIYWHSVKFKIGIAKLKFDAGKIKRRQRVGQCRRLKKASRKYDRHSADSNRRAVSRQVRNYLLLKSI